MKTRLITGMALLGTFFFASRATASVVCTVSGNYRVEPRDTWYCDTDHLPSCAGWHEVDLDEKRGATAAGLKHMRMVLKDSAGNVLDHTATNDNGFYTMSALLPGSSCTGQSVQVQNYFERIHGDDHDVSSPRSRFHLVNSSDVTWNGLVSVTLTGATTTQSRTYLASEDVMNARLANVYYTVNSLVTEVVSWSGRINSLFTGGGSTGESVFRVKYFTANNSLLWGGRSLTVPFGSFADGAQIRHEISHSIHNAIHDGEQLMASSSSSCMSYNLLGSGSHKPQSCEYGFTATKEGLATFFAIRSLTEADTEVFGCSCDADPSIGDGQDVCSKRAASLIDGTPDVDRIDDACTGGSLAGIGDRYSNASSTCARLDDGLGCDCTQSPCESTFWDSEGWQNQTQVQRFLWDMIDASTDGGQDDTNEAITTFIDVLEAMPCSSSTLNVDGTCNEPNNKVSGILSCTPANDTLTQSAPHQGTRHSYNVWDLASLVAGDQTAERSLNCVQGATD